jgi:hypothetical protein
VNTEMIAFCRERWGESETLRWVERSFTEPVSAEPPFDAAICVGNSLSVAPDMATADKIIGGLIAAVRPGGVCVVHVLNLARIAEGPTVWQKFNRFDDQGTDTVLIRGLHRIGMRGFMDLVRLRLSDGKLTHEARTTEILGYTKVDMRRAAAQARDVKLYGGYGFEPFEPTTSTDLILVCRRPGA